MVDQRDFFKEATLRICGNLEIDKALFQCFQYLRNFVPMECFVLNLYEEHFGAIRNIVRVDETGGQMVDELVPISVESRSELLRVRSEEQVMIFNEPKLDPIAREWIKFYGRKDSSFLVMKLILENGPVGTLRVETRGRDRYTPDHAELLSLLRRPFAIALSNAVKHDEVRQLSRQLSKDNDHLYSKLISASSAEIIGANSGLKNVFNMVERVAAVDSPVLLLGETGVGKDVIANAIHSLSQRKNAPIVKINCGAIPESLLDSELFGHEKGAFTGAENLRRGCFERAHKGTLFLDEIGELPCDAQVRMLRVLQHKEVQRVGGKDTINVDVRIIAATNKDLRSMVCSNQFREDLWFRLNVFPIDIPPLRARKEDLPSLLRYFIKLKSRELKIYPTPEPDAAEVDRLMQYDWPGNVREVENMVERGLILSRGDRLHFNVISPVFIKPETVQEAHEAEEFPSLNKHIEHHIRKALKICRGRVEGDKGAARLLEINPSTLRNKMTKMDIPFGRKQQKLH